MNRTLMAAGCVLLLAAACEPTTLQDNTREIHKQERSDGVVPVGAMDEALRAEGTAKAGVIARQCQGALVRSYGNDVSRLARDVGGTLNAAKLQKLGMTEAELAGTYYQAGDYSLNFSGNALTVSASKPGTRGFVSEAFALR